MAKTAWQWDYGQSSQHHVWEDWQTKWTVIDRATKDTIATHRSITEHNAKLHEMEHQWCCKKLTLFPTNICTTFAAGNISGVLRGEMPELAGAEDKGRAKMAWELIYKKGTLL